MKCAICDATIANPTIHPEIGKVEPCDTCMAVVEDCLAGFIDRPSAPEDAFGQDFPTKKEPPVDFA